MVGEASVDDPTPYVTTAAPPSGSYRVRDVRGPVGVHLASDLIPLRIGTAHHIGQDERHRALWFVVVHDAPLPGWYVVIDRRFVLAVPKGQPPAWWRPKGAQ